LPQLAATKTPSAPKHRYAKLSIPKNDDMTDTLMWPSICMFSFRGQHNPNNTKIRYEILHLIAQLQYMHLT
jgi:hypothetical protein